VVDALSFVGAVPLRSEKPEIIMGAGLETAALKAANETQAIVRLAGSEKRKDFDKSEISPVYGRGKHGG
jgi:hypothetical protein